MRRALFAASLPPLAISVGLAAVAIVRVEGRPKGVTETATSVTLTAAAIAAVVLTVAAWRSVRGAPLRWTVAMPAVALLPWLAAAGGAQLATGAMLEVYEPVSWGRCLHDFPPLLAAIEELVLRGAMLATALLAAVAGASMLAGRESRWVALGALAALVCSLTAAADAGIGAQRLMAIRGARSVSETLRDIPPMPSWALPMVTLAAALLLAYVGVRHRRQGAAWLGLLLVVPIAASVSEGFYRFGQVRDRVAVPRAVLFRDAQHSRDFVVVAAGDGLHPGTDVHGPPVPAAEVFDSSLFDAAFMQQWEDAKPYLFVETPEWLEEELEPEPPGKQGKRPEPSRPPIEPPRAASILELLRPPRCLAGFGGTAEVLLTPNGLPALRELVAEGGAMGSLIVERRQRADGPHDLAGLFAVDLGRVRAYGLGSLAHACAARYDPHYLRAPIEDSAVRQLESREGVRPLDAALAQGDAPNVVYFRIGEGTTVDALLRSLQAADDAGLVAVLVNEWPVDAERTPEPPPEPPPEQPPLFGD